MNNSTFEQQLQRNGRLIYTVKGWSMTPFLRENRDLVVIEAIGERVCKKNDIVLYRANGRYVLHRILKVQQQDYVLCGDRCLTKEYGVTDQQILGVMTSFVRDGKTICVDSLRCRLYAFFWCDLFFLRVIILKVGSFLKRLFKRR